MGTTKKPDAGAGTGGVRSLPEGRSDGVRAGKRDGGNAADDTKHSEAPRLLVNAEIEAMGKISDALAPLTYFERRRALWWGIAKYMGSDDTAFVRMLIAWGERTTGT